MYTDNQAKLKTGIAEIMSENDSSLWIQFQTFPSNSMSFSGAFSNKAKATAWLKLKAEIEKLDQRNWIYFNIHATYHTDSNKALLYYKSHSKIASCMVRDQTFKRMHFILELRNSQQTVNIGADEGTEVFSFKIN